MSKKALVIGVNYTGSPQQLLGCVNDAKKIQQSLLDQGYPEENITLLVDDGDKPTRANIVRCIIDLVMSDASFLFLHFSGHGTHIPDKNGDEEDGQDECIVPLDFSENGVITDDQLRGLLNCMRPNQKLFCVFDCCHSGTIIDLKYNLYERFGGRYLAMMKDSHYKATKGQCVMISGCQDPQYSADAYIDGKNQGAMTFCFLEVMDESGWRITYENMILGIRRKLRERNYTQIPNLSSGRNLNLKKLVVL